MVRWISRTVVMAAAVTFCSAACEAGEVGYGGDFEAAMKLVPDHALAAVVVPNMKFCSDEISRCLEGMDRGGLLLGSRALDQWKSAMGFNTGIDDVGGAVVALMPHEGSGEEGTSPIDAVMILPVNDAKGFVESNFTKGDEEGSVKTADGRMLWVKAVEDEGGKPHVVMGETKQAVMGYVPSGAWLKTLKDNGGVRGQRVLQRGELMVVSCQPGLSTLWDVIRAEQERALKDRAQGMTEGDAAQFEAAMRKSGELIHTQLAGAKFAVLNVDFDPLAVIVHKLVGFDETSDAGKVLKGGDSHADGLDVLAKKPYLMMGHMDLKGLGGGAWLGDLVSRFGAQMPAWLEECDGVSMAIMPSSAGLSGGLLNNAVMVIRSEKPTDVVSGLKAAISGEGAAQGVKREVIWEAGKKVDAIENVDAYEVKETVQQGEQQDPQRAMVKQLLFGPSGWKGFVKDVKDAVVVTFSQRPAALTSEVNFLNGTTSTGSANGAAATTGQSVQPMSADGAIKMMRKWMPEHPDAELYVSVGKIAAMVGPMLGMMGGQSMLAGLNENAPPIGFGVEVQDYQVEGTMVVPNAVLVVGVDRMVNTFLHKGPDTQEDDGAAHEE